MRAIETLIAHLEEDHGFANVREQDAEATHQRLHPSHIIAGFNHHAHDRNGMRVEREHVDDGWEEDE